MSDIEKLAARLKPIVVGWMRSERTSGSAAASMEMATHALNGTYHTGTASRTQVPWASSIDELTNHAANPNAHHSQSHVLATTTALGVDHTVAGLTAGQVLRASGATAAAFAQLQHGDLGGVSANQHHNQIHSVTGTDHTITASALQVVGATATDTLGLLTPDADPGTTPSILRNDATGKLTLPLFKATTSISAPLLTTTSGDLTIDPVGVVKFPIAQTLKTADFNSDFPILGWQINENPAIAGQSALTIGAIAADELHVKIFVADETRVDRGDEYWTKSYGIVAETFTTPSTIGGTVTVVFEDSPALEGAIFSVNDWLLFRQVDIDTGFDLATIWGQVSGYTDLADGLQSWTFTLRSGETLKEIRTGSLATDFGATNAGLIHLSTIDIAGAPYIKMRRWSGANPYEPANYTTYVQIGHLGGVSNASLPAPSGYGLYVRSGTADRGIIIDDNGLLIQGADLKLYNGATQTVNLSYTGTDFWIGPSSLDKRFLWDGTALSITGSVYATAGYIGGTTAGWAIEAGKLTSTNIELLSGASARLQVGSGSDIAGVAAAAAGTDIAFWAGDTYANRATADFRLTAAGALYATTGTIAGDFTVASPGRIIAGGGHVIASVSGLDISSYDYDSSPNPNPTENVRSIAWWPDAATKSPTDTPDARIWGGRGANGERIIQFDVDPVDGTAPRMWLQKSVHQLGFVGIKSVWGLPGLSINESASIATVTIGETSRFILNPTSTFLSYTHLKTAYVNAAPAYDIGEAGTKWRTIYVGHIEADTISGTSLSGATWRHDAASMGIYSSSAGTRTLTIANDGDGVMNVEIDGSLKVVTGNITLEGAGATVDGVDLSAFYTAYGSHSHALPAHAYDDAVHTGTLSWSKVSKTGSNLNEIATRSHTVLSDIGSYTHAQIDSHINTADTHVAHSTVSVLGGNGLTGGGTINATQTLHVAVSGLGLSVGADAVTLTSSSAGEANAHILATDVNGYTQVQRLGIGGAPTAYNLAVTGTGRFSSTLYAGDDLDVYDTLTVGGAGSVTGNFKVGAGAGVLRVLAAGQRVGINCDADSQFSLDIAGAARAEYWVGPHAIQLSGAVAIMHFDGAAPYNKDFSGTPDTHMGVRGTVTGQVVYRPGLFNKAIQMAVGAKNCITNPRFEIDTSGWTAQETTNIARIAHYTAPYGGYALIVDPQGDIGNGALFDCTSTTSAGTQYTVSMYVYPLLSTIFRLWLYDDVSAAAYTDFSGLPLNQWTRITKTGTFHASSTFRAAIIQNATSLHDFLVTAVQLETGGRATAYHDGSLTIPASWDTPASPHASTSTRVAPTLSYPIAIQSGSPYTLMGYFNFDMPARDYGYLWHTINDAHSAYYGAGGLSIGNISTAFPSAGWHHVALTIDGSTAIAYLDGVSVGSTSLSPSSGSALYVGGYSTNNYPFDGLIDDFVVLDRAAEAKEILSIYASNAPVFAESSVISFRAPTKANLRVDEYGMWFTGAAGGEIFGMYGGDPARILTTQSWGGVTMEEGDVVIGRTTGTGAAIHWDDSESTLRLGVKTGNHLELTSTTFKIKAGTAEKISLDASGNASITGVLAMGANGSITATDTTVDANGITLKQGGGAANQIKWNALTGSAIVGYIAANVAASNILDIVGFNGGGYYGEVNLLAITPAGTTGGQIQVKGSGVINATGNTAITGTLSATGAITQNGNQVWHAGNDGHLSYLDADYLDGYEASAFGRLAATNTWSAAQTFSNGVTLDTAGVLSARADTDTLHYIGRAAIGYTGFADYAVFSHRDMADTTNYAFMQGATGFTFINAASGASILFRNANNDIASISSTGMLIPGGALGVTGLITATGGINSGAAYQRSGTAGYIFVPLYAASLTDTASHPWDGSEARQPGVTYYFDLSSYSIPDTAKAVVVAISANWSAASQSHYMIARGKDTGHVGLVIRSHTASVNNDAMGIVELNSTHDLEIYIADSGVAPGVTACRLIGYFV